MSNIEIMKQALAVMWEVNTDDVCKSSHHRKEDQHGQFDPCPVTERWLKAFCQLRMATWRDRELLTPLTDDQMRSQLRPVSVKGDKA